MLGLCPQQLWHQEFWNNQHNLYQWSMLERKKDELLAQLVQFESQLLLPELDWS